MFNFFFSLQESIDYVEHLMSRDRYIYLLKWQTMSTKRTYIT